MLRAFIGLKHLNALNVLNGYTVLAFVFSANNTHLHNTGFVIRSSPALAL